MSFDGQWEDFVKSFGIEQIKGRKCLGRRVSSPSASSRSFIFEDHSPKCGSCTPPTQEPLSPRSDLHIGVNDLISRSYVKKIFKMKVDRVLDLHMLTREMAVCRLRDFIYQSWEDGIRLVMVITGIGKIQGTGVIRSSIASWINEVSIRRCILHAEWAKAKGGGCGGALYILIRRKKRPDQRGESPG